MLGLVFFKRSFLLIKYKFNILTQKMKTLKIIYLDTRYKNLLVSTKVYQVYKNVRLNLNFQIRSYFEKIIHIFILNIK